MSASIRLFLGFVVCAGLSGCGGSDGDPADEGGSGRPVVNPGRSISPVTSPANEEPKAEETDDGPALTDYIPESITLAIGAHPSKVPDELRELFFSQFEPIRQLLPDTGIDGLAGMTEFWVGSSAEGDMAICIQTADPYDKAKVKAAMKVQVPLGKRSGAEIFALPEQPDSENAIALIDSKTFIVGRKKTVEAALSKPQPGPVRKGLQACGENGVYYWVAGDSQTVSVWLANHDLTPGFSGVTPQLLQPEGFAVTLRSADEKPDATGRSPVGGAFSGKGAGFRGRGAGFGDDDDDDDDDDRGRFGGRFTRAAMGGPTIVPFAPYLTTSAKSQGLSYTMGFFYRSVEVATVMEELAKSALKGFEKQLAATAQAERDAPRRLQQAPSGTESRDDDDDDDDRPRRRGRAGNGGGRRFPPPAARGGPRERSARFPRFGRFGSTGRTVQPPKIFATSRQGAAVQIDFRRTITAQELDTVVSEVYRATGVTPIGDGIFEGSLPGLSRGTSRWQTETSGPLTGMRKVPGKRLAVHAGFSWMTELLPYIGRDDLYVQINFKQSWAVDNNRKVALTVIPEFINPKARRAKWQGFPFAGMGLTHFVGMSGLEDEANVVAARLDRTDPRAGVFGYGKVARPDEVTDGASNTIMVIGAGRLASPWIQAGGATVRGARKPYFAPITGFGSEGLQKPGAYVLFVDGSSRALPATIDEKVFRAMCTIGGNEQIDLKKLTAVTEKVSP